MKNICQSCGMPLKSPEMYGTGPDGTRMEDYCVYCYKDGGFTSDVTMEEMMRLCANYVDGDTRNYYIANMRTLYPYLKRWAKKEDTRSEYYKSINRVIDHIKSNLHENAGLKTLAGVAGISPYHFHRIFKSVIGKSLAEYVTRLKMEYVARQLKVSGSSLSELAAKTGYSSEQALSRIFKKYFDLPPKTFRAIFFRQTFGAELSPRICKVARKNIIMLREILPGGQGWQKLYMYAMMNRLLSDSTESIEVIRDGLYRQAVTTRELSETGKHVDAAALPEGLYAIFTHRGDTQAIPALYTAANNYWLTGSKYRHCAERTAYVIYINNPSMVPPSEVLSEIYIPLVEK